MLKLNSEAFKGLFKSADSRFQLITALKMCIPGLVSTIFIIYSFSLFTQMLTIILGSTGIIDASMKDAIFDFLMKENTEYFIYLLLFFVFLFAIGGYLSSLMLRSFKDIEQFCLETMDNPNMDFSTQVISGKKIVMQMSSEFFTFLNNSRKMNKIRPQEVNEYLMDINTPVIDKVFYFQYILILTIVILVVSLANYTFISSVYEKIIQISTQMVVVGNGDVLGKQIPAIEPILSMITVTSIFMMIIMYALISKNLVQKVDGVSYHFFRVMREIMLGNYTSRVRLRQDDPGKESAQVFNKLMDDILPKGKNLLKKESDVEGPVVGETPSAPDLPPPVTEDIKNAGTIQIVTPEGFKVKGLTKQEALELIQMAEKKKKS